MVRSLSLVFPSLSLRGASSVVMLFSEFTTLAFSGLAFTSSVVLGTVLNRRATAFFNPTDGGGSMFADAGNGLGEPLNVRKAHDPPR